MSVPIAPLPVAARSDILIVEDDTEQLRILGAILEQEPVNCISARSGAEAIEQLPLHSIQLILLDLGLPTMDGFELLRQLKKNPHAAQVPVIVVTGWNSAADRIRGLDLGAADFLTKPYHADELLARVRAALRTREQVNELARALRESERARALAEESVREKGEFLAKISHEIRTPLNGVIAITGVLSESDLSPDQRDLLETIRVSGESLLNIIDDILHFSKMESGKLELESEPFDLRHCLWDVIDLFAAKAAEKNLELICSVEECVPSPIVGDAMRLRQVIVNLVSNALKFTEKGEVAIEVTMAPLGSSERQPDASSEPGGLRLLFSIRDTGIGVAPNKLDRLFQSFSQVASTTARQYGGTGLGLAICRGLIERMGGTIRADSVEGQGTTFRFSLPFGVAATGAWRLSPPQLAGRRVLIVDDHPGSRRNLAEQVSQWSMVAVACEHGDEALARVRAEEKFDVVILDWRLPGIPGEELAMALRALPAGSRLPIVFLTPIGTRIENEKLLAESYVNLRKPSRPAALQRALRRLVGGEITSPSPTRVEPVTPPSQSPLATRYPVKILLADDNVINQKVAVRLLQQIGYQATVVADGREVLAALEAAPFDLVFMDVQMPELDGLEATRRIRQRQADPSSPANFRRRIRIVAMTANVVQGDREKCLGAGMDEYLPKPVRPAALAEMVERFGAELAEPISAPGPTPVANPGTERFTPFPVSSAANSSPETVNELPVDLDRLMEFAGSDNGMWNELVSLYLTQTGDQLRQLRQALEDSDASRVVRIAHSCAGASGTCGMVSMHSRLRELEQRAKGGDLSSARGLFAPVSETLHLTKEFLKVQPNITPPTRELCSL